MGSQAAALGGLMRLNLMMWDRVFDPVGRPEGPQFHFPTQTLRRFAPLDRVGDPVPHGRNGSLARSARD